LPDTGKHQLTENLNTLFMTVQFNTDHNVNGKESLTGPFKELITEELSRYAEHITRIEAHLTDEDGKSKHGGNDKRCVLEARIEGRQPIAVTSHESTYQLAVEGAIDRLKASLETIFDKAGSHR
jgi:ribosome-associated translation inhibitor RaiA